MAFAYQDWNGAAPARAMVARAATATRVESRRVMGLIPSSEFQLDAA
jgi:hypothetical protein